MDFLTTNNKHFEKTENLTDRQKYGDRFSGTKGDTLTMKNIYGSLVFYLVFIIIIPFLIYKSGNHELLVPYLPNIDLIATVVSFLHGPYGALEFLYLDERPFIGFMSKNIINYVVLMSLFFTILRESVVHKRVSLGLSKVCIILLTTYLLPNRYIIEWMHRFYDYIGGVEPSNKDLMHGLVNIDNISWFITVGVGLMISVGIIGFEGLLIDNYSKGIAVFMENIIKKF